MRQITMFNAHLLSELEKGTIKCGSCKKEKPIEEFGANKTKKNGKAEYCKTCVSARDKKYAMSPEGKAKRKASKRAYDKTEKGAAAKKVRAKRWQATHPKTLSYQYLRERDLKKNFNLTQAQYDVMLANQGGVCAICKQPDSRKKKDGTPISLAVDHNHATGEIRGLLCGKCNTSLGRLENEEFFRPALAYLEKFSTSRTPETAS